MITNLNDFLILEASSTAKSTALLKKYLKDKYNIKAKVSSSSYSGGSSLRVSYVGGPSEKIVKNDLSRLQYGRFNSMEDIYDYKDDAETGIRINDTDLETYKYVFVEQELSDDILFRMAKIYSNKYNFSDLPKLNDISEFDKQFDNMEYGVWNWRQLMSRKTKEVNFVTDDLENVVILDTEDINNPYFIYEYKGKKYRTDKLEIVNNQSITTNKKSDVTKKEPVKRERTPILNGIRLVDYSERAIAVLGNTYEIKDKLIELGGRFNKFLTVDGEKTSGWIFPKSKEDSVATLLAEYE